MKKFNNADKIPSQHRCHRITLCWERWRMGSWSIVSRGGRRRFKRQWQKTAHCDARRALCHLEQETVRAKVVISCVGSYVESNAWFAIIEGRETFQGDVVHTGRWRKNVDFQKNNVVVIESGCSAAQVVPAILNEPYNVKSVTQIMRTPPWMGPTISPPFGPKAYARSAPAIFHYFPFLGYLFRISLFFMVEMIFLSAFQRINVKWRSMFEDDRLKRMRSTVPAKYHTIMTPTHPYGSKRRLFAPAWLESMNSKYNLTTQIITCVKSTAMVFDSVGSVSVNFNSDMKMARFTAQMNVHVDIIFLANGYNATYWLHPLAVYERGLKFSHDVWNERESFQAYMSMALNGFSNFFMIGGPNTVNGHWLLILVTKNMIGYIFEIIKSISTAKPFFVEIKKQVALNWIEQNTEEFEIYDLSW